MGMQHYMDSLDPRFSINLNFTYRSTARLA